MWVLAVALVLSCSSQVSAVAAPERVSCKNAANQEVDWFVAYKTPMLNQQHSGLEYVYMDSLSTSPRLMRSPQTISDPDGPLANTLRPMLRSVRNMPESFGFLSYSDQPPGATANHKVFGHSKGVVMGDRATQTALWLTHSTPQFPKRNQNHFWPLSGKKKGQTFLCVSLPFTELGKVGQHLRYIRAYSFDFDLPTDFPTELQNAASWSFPAAGNTELGQFQGMSTRGRVELMMMAKTTGSSARDGDLYVKLATGLKSDVRVQVWGCQRDSSFCDVGQKQVLSVESLQTGVGTWQTNIDHSKWAVTTAPGVTWTCFGDMNRQSTQYERWGGALCIRHTQLNSMFIDISTQTLRCGKRPIQCSDYEQSSESDSDSSFR